jgi:hypothetical protein
MARALYMGDELHNRPVAGTALFALSILPHLIETSEDKQQLSQITSYFASNEIFFLCLAMAACKPASLQWMQLGKLSIAPL